jgi:UDP-2-acetamido-2-deoxy-ribo-hexuluronate aminotransferase
MEFIDLKKQYEVIEKNINIRFQEILQDSRFIMGKEVRELEEILANYVGVKHCITCANGTDALQLALMAKSIGEGDAVFVPSFTFYATSEAVSFIGATPVFVDVKHGTFNLDPDKLETAIQGVQRERRLKPKAVIPVDLFGLPAEYDKIRKITEKYGMIIVEDAAQGFGGSINGKKACSFGDISTTSFFPAKPLGCYGDGGAIFTNDEQAADLINSLKIHGKGRDKYQNTRVGMNSRLDTLQAAVLLEKIKIFDSELEERNKIASLYEEGLINVLSVPKVERSAEHTCFSSWAQYTLKAKSEAERTMIMSHLKEKKIPAMIYYPIPLHKQEVYADYITTYCDLSVSEDISKRVFSLPMHPYLEEAEAAYIIETVLELFNKY